MTKLDDTNWHVGSDDFPPEAPEENGATHIGFFVAWAISRELWGGIPGADCSVAVKRVQDRHITGREFVLEACDGKLFSAWLTEEGRSFAEAYYPQRYIKDYQRTLVTGLESDYWVEDNRDNCERMAGVIDEHYTARNEKPWWKFW